MARTDYYPVFLDLRGRACLVVGGGPIGLEKIEGLLKANANVTVIAREVIAPVRALASAAKIRLLERPLLEGDLDGFFLVIAATDLADENRAVYAAREAQGRLANAVDDPDYCNFILGAVVREGPVAIAVSSAGASPIVAQQLRDRIRNEVLTPAAGALADVLGSWRPQAKACIEGYGARKAFWEAVVASEVPALVAEGQLEKADERIAEVLTHHCANGCAAKGVCCQRKL